MLITLHGYDNSAAPGIDPNMTGYDFTNRIKSSMLFEADSEIALVNATIERIIEYTVTAGTNQMELDTDEIGGAILLTIAPGNYTPEALQTAIQAGLDSANTFGYRFTIIYESSTGSGINRKWKINWIYAPLRTSETAILLDVNEPKYSIAGTGSGTWTWTEKIASVGPFADFAIAKYAGTQQWSWEVTYNAGADKYYIKERIMPSGAIEYPWSATETDSYNSALLGRMLISEVATKSVLTFNNMYQNLPLGGAWTQKSGGVPVGGTATFSGAGSTPYWDFTRVVGATTHWWKAVDATTWNIFSTAEPTNAATLPDVTGTISSLATGSVITVNSTPVHEYTPAVGTTPLSFAEATCTALTGETGATGLLVKVARGNVAFDAGNAHTELAYDATAYKGWGGKNSYAIFGASDSLVGWQDLTYDPSNDDLSKMSFFQAENPFNPATMDYELSIGLDIAASTGREYQRAWIDDGIVDNVTAANGAQFRVKTTGMMEIREAGVKLTTVGAPTLDMSLKPGLAIALAGTSGYVRYFFRKSPVSTWEELKTGHPTPADKKYISQIFPTVAVPFVSARSGDTYAAADAIVNKIAGSMAIDYKPFGWDVSGTDGKGTNSEAAGAKTVEWKATTSTAFAWRLSETLDLASADEDPNILEPGIAGYVDFQLANQDGSTTAKVNNNHQAGLLKRASWASYVSGDAYINSVDFEVRFLFEPTSIKIFHTPTSAVAPIYTGNWTNVPDATNTIFRIIRNPTPSGSDAYQFGYMTSGATPEFVNLVSGVYYSTMTDLAPGFQTNFGTDFAAPEGGYQAITVGFSDFDTTEGDVTFRPRTMANLLGFQLTSYVEDNGDDGFTSDKLPNDSLGGGCASPEIHIQLPNLPIQSLNGFTHREEKTLAVIPRYKADDIDKTGVRSLYYHGCDWLLYSPLFFKHKINLNEISVKLTNNDGTPAIDVDCCSLTLDIRPRVTT